MLQFISTCFKLDSIHTLLNNQEIDEIVSLAFQLTDSIPATWPGSTGPQQLVQSELIEQEHQPKQMYTAERLSLTFDSKYAENVAGGILSCRYIRPKGILPMDSDEAAESITKVTIPQTNDDDDEIIEKSEIPMKELLGKSISIYIFHNEVLFLSHSKQFFTKVHQLSARPLDVTF